MSRETPPCSLPAVGGQDRRERRETEAGGNWPSLTMKALSTSAVFYGIGHGLMGAQQTSQQLGRLAVECFSGEESVTGC